MSQADQKRFNKYFRQKGILYQPGYAIIFGNLNAGILLSQLLYWHGKGKDREGWIYKTAEGWRKETGLTRYELETARRTLIKHSILDYKRSGNPCTSHYRLNLLKLEEALPSLLETNNLVYLKPPDSISAKPQTLISESTQKTTTKSTPPINKSNYKKQRTALLDMKGFP